MRLALALTAILLAGSASATYATYVNEGSTWQIAYGGHVAVMDSDGSPVQADAWIARRGDVESLVWINGSRMVAQESRIVRGNEAAGMQWTQRTWAAEPGPCILADVEPCSAWPLEGNGTADVEGPLPLPSRAYIQSPEAVVEWQRNAVGTSSWSAPTQADVADVEMHTMAAWGPEDEPPHPFPLSEAYEEALRWSPLASLWAADHPEHFALQANHSVVWAGGEVGDSWTFTLGAGDAGLRVTSQRLRESGAVTVARAEEVTPQEVSVPSALPSIADLSTRLQVLGSPAATSWGFDLASERIWVESGYMEVQSLGAMSLAGTMLTTDLEGRSQAYFNVAVNDTGPLGTPGETAPKPALGQAPRPSAPGMLVPVVATGTVGLLIPFLAWLFTRLRRSKVDGHPRRRQILDVIASHPGIHLESLARETGLANGTLRHHLQVLKKATLVRTRREGGYVCCYARDGAVAGDWALKSVLARRLLEDMEQHPSSTIAERCRRLDCARSSLYHHLERLRDAGLVDAP